MFQIILIFLLRRNWTFWSRRFVHITTHNVQIKTFFQMKTSFQEVINQCLYFLVLVTSCQVTAACTLLSPSSSWCVFPEKLISGWLAVARACTAGWASLRCARRKDGPREAAPRAVLERRQDRRLHTWNQSNRTC